MRRICGIVAATVVVVGLATTPASAATDPVRGQAVPVNICKWLPSFCR